MAKPFRPAEAVAHCLLAPAPARILIVTNSEPFSTARPCFLQYQHVLQLQSNSQRPHPQGTTDRPPLLQSLCLTSELQTQLLMCLLPTASSTHQLTTTQPHCGAAKTCRATQTTRWLESEDIPLPSPNACHSPAKILKAEHQFTGLHTRKSTSQQRKTNQPPTPTRRLACLRPSVQPNQQITAHQHQLQHVS
ncbi:hypothetical protein ETH_00001455 [Eimeria tenella]|uniref:Uncharacterized protein n=1 Tax=Eimeria tenella TaxID=5802 RepID=U6L040_EIMTE|nr:hypothetical protein ETH_00001455 [Eimeria tenella]CDJ41929.1 hypothetical protein ETH_00001455 [Eimeria tenella]|eukprot:XP_013232679.1 hypothetical protein ETH_00001455 [Eimeria tenella]